MHEILQSLHEDHVNLMKLLTSMRRELHGAVQDGDPDYNLLMDALDYIKNHADAVHHVREDQIYARLKQAHQEHAPLVERLMLEHQQLQESTIEAMTVLSNALNDVILDKRTLEDSVENFLIAQQDHMGVEEREVFPLVDSVFEADDWQYVATRIHAGEDPLFGEQVEDRYQALYMSLTAAD